MDITKGAEKFSQPIGFKVDDLRSGCILAANMFDSIQYHQVLAPYETVSRHNLDTGMLTPLRAALEVGINHPSSDLAVVTEEMAQAAIAVSFGYSGMRISWTLKRFASRCQSGKTLSPVDLANALRDIIENLPKVLPSTSQPLISSADLNLSALHSIAINDVLNTLTYSLLAAVSIPEVGTEGGVEVAPTTDGPLSSLEPDLVAFLLLSFSLAQAVEPDESAKYALRTAVDEVLFRLPQLTRPAVITTRAQRLYTCVLDIEGPAEALVRYRGSTPSKDVVWAVGGADLFGWENWHLVHRAVAPTVEIPDFSKRSNVLIVSPPPAVEIGLERASDPINTPRSSNVVTLEKNFKRSAQRPTVLVLTHCQDLIPELLPMGVNVLYNYRSAAGLRRVLSAFTSFPVTILTSDQPSADLCAQVLGSFEVDEAKQFVHAGCAAEIEALHKARYACAYYFGSDSEERLSEAISALEQAEGRMRFFSTSDRSLADLSEAEMFAGSNDFEAASTNFLVEIPADLDAVEFQFLESSLARLTGPAANISYFQGRQRGVIKILQTW